MKKIQVQPVSADPQDFGNIDESLWYVLQKFGEGLECCIPAVVRSYDRGKNEVLAVPAIRAVLPNAGGEGGRALSDRPPVSVPALTLGGGGFIVNFPLNPGDTGWIVASDRNADNFLETLEISDPNTAASHKWSFGVFIPDKVKKFSVDEADAAGMVIQSLDGSSKIVLKNGQLEIIGKALINVESSLTKISGDVQIVGDLRVGEVDFLTHVHGGVETGGGTTGIPR